MLKDTASYLNLQGPILIKSSLTKRKFLKELNDFLSLLREVVVAESASNALQESLKKLSAIYSQTGLKRRKWKEQGSH